MNVSDKLAVLMEFNGYTKDELEAYLSLKFGAMTKGEMTASILSQSGCEKVKSVIFEQPQSCILCDSVADLELEAGGCICDNCAQIQGELSEYEEDK